MLFRSLHAHNNSCDCPHNTSGNSSCIERIATEIAQRACGFADLRHEQLYNLLQFVIEIADKAEMDPLCFAVRHSDPPYIKREKARLMLAKRDTVDSTVLKRQLHLSVIPGHLPTASENTTGVKIDVLKQCMASGLVIEELLDGPWGADLGRLLRLMADGPAAWIRPAADFLRNSISISQDRAVEKNGPGQAHMELALEAAGSICTEVPEWVYHISGESCPLGLMRLYCRLRQRGVLSRTACLDFLERLRGEAPTVRRIAVVMENISQADADDVYTPDLSYQE